MTGERVFARARKKTIGGADPAADGATTPRRRGLVAILLALVMGVAGLLGTAAPAAAAPTVTYPGAISNVSLESRSGGGPLVQWQHVRISADWAVPVGAQGGETFGMTLPVEFTRHAAGDFVIADPATGVIMANCVVDAGQGPDVVCTLTDAVNGMEDVDGSFWLDVRASQVTSSETVEFDLGDTIEIVDLPGSGGVIPGDPTKEEDDEPYKYGGLTATEGLLRWVVGVPSAHVSGGAFTITDTLDGGLAAHHYTGDVRLTQRPVENGVLVGAWTAVDPTKYRIAFADDGQSFDFSVSGLPTGGFAYQLIYYTQADGPVAEGDVFGNQAVVNTIKTSATHKIVETAGGEGSGVVFTTFSIAKELTGTQAEAARSATYTVRYSVKGADAPATTLTVPVGQSVVSDRAPLGSTFVIEEIDLPQVDGVAWGAWTLSGDGVVDAGNGTYEVTPDTAAGVELTLTNVANSVPPVQPEPTPTPTPAPTPTPTIPAPSPTPSPSSPPAALASTGGGDASGFVALAVALVVGGGLATGVAMKRRSSVGRL